jgi:hypothetical protein
MAIITHHSARTAPRSQAHPDVLRARPRHRTAVPLLGPADAGTAIPVMGIDTGTVTPVLGAADAGTVNPVMGIDTGTATSVTGTDTGTATPVMSSRR